MKIWDILDQTAPILAWEQSSNLGAIQCLAANPDNGFIFVAGGDNKAHNFQVLDLREISTRMYSFYMNFEYHCWLLHWTNMPIDSAGEIRGCGTCRVE